MPAKSSKTLNSTRVLLSKSNTRVVEYLQMQINTLKFLETDSFFKKSAPTIIFFMLFYNIFFQNYLYQHCLDFASKRFDHAQ